MTHVEREPAMIKPADPIVERIPGKTEFIPGLRVAPRWLHTGERFVDPKPNQLTQV